MSTCLGKKWGIGNFVRRKFCHSEGSLASHCAEIFPPLWGIILFFHFFISAQRYRRVMIFPHFWLDFCLMPVKHSIKKCKREGGECGYSCGKCNLNSKKINIFSRPWFTISFVVYCGFLKIKVLLLDKEVCASKMCVLCCFPFVIIKPCTAQKKFVWICELDNDLDWLVESNYSCCLTILCDALQQNREQAYFEMLTIKDDV